MFKHILVAIDRSPSTPVTLSYATALAHQDGASVAVLHVNRFVAGRQVVTELPAADAAEMVDQAVRHLLDEGVAATGSVIHAPAFALGQTVGQHALEHRSDVIVLGSRRHTVLPRFIGQGVRDRVTRHSALPVLIAPAPLRVTGRWHRRVGQDQLESTPLRGTA